MNQRSLNWGLDNKFFLDVFVIYSSVGIIQFKGGNIVVIGNFEVVGLLQNSGLLVSLSLVTLPSNSNVYSTVFWFEGQSVITGLRDPTTLATNAQFRSFQLVTFKKLLLSAMV